MKPGALILIVFICVVYSGGLYVVIPYFKEKFGYESGTEIMKVRFAAMCWPVVFLLVWLEKF